MRGGEALNVLDGKGLGKGFHAGDPDDSAILRGRANEERGHEVREEVVTEDIGAEDLPKRGVGSCLRVIGYWIDGFLVGALRGGCEAHAADFVGWVCDGYHRFCKDAPYRGRPIDAGEGASSSIEDD